MYGKNVAYKKIMGVCLTFELSKTNPWARIPPEAPFGPFLSNFERFLGPSIILGFSSNFSDIVYRSQRKISG